MKPLAVKRLQLADIKMIPAFLLILHGPCPSSQLSTHPPSSSFLSLNSFPKGQIRGSGRSPLPSHFLSLIPRPFRRGEDVGLNALQGGLEMQSVLISITCSCNSSFESPCGRMGKALRCSAFSLSLRLWRNPPFKSFKA